MRTSSRMDKVLVPHVKDCTGAEEEEEIQFTTPSTVTQSGFMESVSEERIHSASMMFVEMT